MGYHFFKFFEEESIVVCYFLYYTVIRNNGNVEVRINMYQLYYKIHIGFSVLLIILGVGGFLDIVFVSDENHKNLLLIMCFLCSILGICNLFCYWRILNIMRKITELPTLQVISLMISQMIFPLAMIFLGSGNWIISVGLVLLLIGIMIIFGSYQFEMQLPNLCKDLDFEIKCFNEEEE